MAPAFRNIFISPEGIGEVFAVLEISPLQAVRDPVRAMRVVASLDEERLERFMALVLYEPPTFLRAGDGANEEGLRLYAGAVLALLLQRVRGIKAMVTQ